VRQNIQNRYFNFPGGILRRFFGEDFLRFCGGFLKKRVVGRGFLMVNLWWKRGELWCVDGRYLGPEIFHGFWIYF
jgi:hypothetical protein